MVTSLTLELGVVTERTKRILELLHKTGALLYGAFTRASGKKSDHYYDGKQFSMHLGPLEIVLSIVIIFIFFGVGRLRQVGGVFARGRRAFKRGTSGEGEGEKETKAEKKTKRKTRRKASEGSK